MSLPSEARELDAARALLERLEAHARGERAHAHRVAVYAVATGETLGISDGRLVALHRAALLHDIGKLGVEPALLAIQGPVDPDSLALMREHTALAEPVLTMAGFGPEVIEIVRDHHERHDGSGYPHGLQGDNLSREAQCVGLAEAFDLHAFGAPWAVPRGDEAATRLASSYHGRAFCTEVVDAFLSVQPLIQPVLER
ncbi:MAG: HD-GYP domain-containing protein [Fimbriimonadaceae bacterium]